MTPSYCSLHQDDMHTLVEFMNSIRSSIEFTMEKKVETQPVFLDVLIIGTL